MHKSFVLLVLFITTLCYTVLAQQTKFYALSLKVNSEKKLPLAGATVQLLKHADSALVKIQVTDSSGLVRFAELTPTDYFIRISYTGYATHTSEAFSLQQSEQQLNAVSLQALNSTLSSVTVTAKKPFIELAPGKTIVNLDAGITNAGTTALEALEKMPGVTIDKDGRIALKGKQGVTVMIDGKPTYLGSAELVTMLNGMSSSQISQVELIDQPSSRYDAAGNAGIINIKIKKNKQKGFNGSVSTTYAQGRYPKTNNNLQLNYRAGKWNLFANYGINASRNFTDLYALRTYYNTDGSVASKLEQPSYFSSSQLAHNLRSGIDFFLNTKTTIGLGLSGIALSRDGSTNNKAMWMNATGNRDSLIVTQSSNNTNWKNAAGNLNFRHTFTSTRELTADVDLIGYRIQSAQFFENNFVGPSGYTDATRADLPSDIRIVSAKTDYTTQLKNWKTETGIKTSHITTDNLAAYELKDAGEWKEDLGKSNHFLYTENIHALYGNAETKIAKWKLQGGLRYEMTNYDAHQLGNAIVKDSAFSRSYNSLFPSFFTSVDVDSSNTFSFSAGRRIDRPAFQKLNPFLFIINKYTYQQGNPFFRPQYSWNMELSHLYKGVLVTGLSYSVTKDYFSQVFLADTSGIITYTEGNLAKLQNFGLSAALQVSPFSWWSLSAQGVINHRKMQGTISRNYNVSITQSNFSFNNQFRFSKGWGAELSGFYTSRAQNDIQEIVDPAGQVSTGVSKQLMKNKATARMTVRDIFYTQWMKGNTVFQGSTEYFKMTRDTRMLTLSFTYRFGKTFKTVKRSGGAAGEEMQRVGNG